MNKKNWTIKKKILTGFSILFMMLFVQMFLVWIFQSSIIDNIKTAKNEGFKGAVLAKDVSSNVIQVQQYLTDISATQAQDGYDDGFDLAEKNAKKFKKNLKAYLEIHPEKKAFADEMSSAFDDYYETGKKMANAYISGGPASGNVLMAQFDEKSIAINEKVAKLVNFSLDEAYESTDKAIDNSNQTLYTFIILIILIIGISILISYVLSKKISEPILELTRFAEAFKNGESNDKLNVKSDDEVETLAEIFDEMVEQIGLQISYLNNLPTPVFIIDKQFKVQYINKVGSALIGETQNACKNKPCYEIIQGEHCNTDNCGLKKAMRDKETHTQEHSAGAKGKKADFMYTGSPIVNRHGELVGAMEFVADITDIKDAERYLERNTVKILGAMEKVANGDLTVKVNPEKQDDNIAKLYLAFNRTVQNLRNMTNQIKDAVSATASASTQISSSAEEMAAGAQEQSAQTGDVATAMEEMTSTIVETNKNTNMAAEAVKDSGQLAQEGGEAVKNTIIGMESIAEVVITAAETVKKLGEDSERIGEIISVINDIADQTNLLALNAAIEAARAGEQGRGFAVVADEVRKLAERTTGATKEIAEMITKLQSGTGETVTSIQKGVDEVSKGKQLAEKAGESMSEIESSSTRAMDLVTQVATASEEQSATSEQVAKNIEAINMVSQESAAGVEQIAKASEDLNRLTENLQQLIEQFKIDESDNKNYSLGSEHKTNEMVKY